MRWSWWWDLFGSETEIAPGPQWKISEPRSVKDTLREVEQFLDAAIKQVGPEKAALLTLGWLQAQIGKTEPFEEVRRRMERANG